MKYQEKPVELKINQFSFTLTPLEISFDHTGAETYALEFCKGAQVYKKFEEVIWVHAEEKNHRLVNEEFVVLKLQSEKIMKYEWSVYKLTDDELKDYMASVPIDLTKYYGQMTQKLKQSTSFISSSSVTEQQWKNLRESKLPFKFDPLVAKNTKEGISITFSLTIGSELGKSMTDQKLKQLNKQNSKKSLRAAIDESNTSLMEESVIKDSSKNYSLNYSQNEGSVDLSKIEIHSLKKNDTLSDIIEASNDSSTIRNHEDKNHKLNSMISQIPEEREESSPTFRPSTKTQDFQKINMTFGPLAFNKRSHTLREEYDDSDAKALESMRRHMDKKDSTIKGESSLGLETAPQSQISQNNSNLNSISSPEKYGKNSVCLLIIVLLIVGLAASSLLFSDGKTDISIGGVNIGKAFDWVRYLASKGKSNSSNKKGGVLDSKSKKKGGNFVSNSKKKNAVVEDSWLWSSVTIEEDDWTVGKKNSWSSSSKKKGEVSKTGSKTKIVQIKGGVIKSQQNKKKTGLMGMISWISSFVSSEQISQDDEIILKRKNSKKEGVNRKIKSK